MGIRIESSQLRIIQLNLVAQTEFPDSMKGFKNGDFRVAATLSKYAIPNMSLFISRR